MKTFRKLNINGICIQSLEVHGYTYINGIDPLARTTNFKKPNINDIKPSTYRVIDGHKNISISLNTVKRTPYDDTFLDQKLAEHFFEFAGTSIDLCIINLCRSHQRVRYDRGCVHQAHDHPRVCDPLKGAPPPVWTTNRP